MAAFMKLEISAPQKMNRYSLGMLFGRRRFLAITTTTNPKMMLLTDETTEAEICKTLVMSTLFETLPQKEPIATSV